MARLGAASRWCWLRRDNSIYCLPYGIAYTVIPTCSPLSQLDCERQAGSWELSCFTLDHSWQTYLARCYKKRVCSKGELLVSTTINKFWLQRNLVETINNKFLTWNIVLEQKSSFQTLFRGFGKKIGPLVFGFRFEIYFKLSRVYSRIRFSLISIRDLKQIVGHVQDSEILSYRLGN